MGHMARRSDIVPAPFDGKKVSPLIIPFFQPIRVVIEAQRAIQMIDHPHCIAFTLSIYQNLVKERKRTSSEPVVDFQKGPLFALKLRCSTPSSAIRTMLCL